jgi:hypothetical protein
MARRGEGMRFAAWLLGWTREKRVDDAGWFRGIEEDQQVIDLTAGPAQPSTPAGAGSLSRREMCRRTYLEGSDWRKRLPQYQECLTR